MKKVIFLMLVVLSLLIGVLWIDYSSNSNNEQKLRAAIEGEMTAEEVSLTQLIYLSKKQDDNLALLNPRQLGEWLSLVRYLRSSAKETYVQSAIYLGYRIDGRIYSFFSVSEELEVQFICPDGPEEPCEVVETLLDTCEAGNRLQAMVSSLGFIELNSIELSECYPNR